MGVERNAGAVDGGDRVRLGRVVVLQLVGGEARLAHQLVVRVDVVDEHAVAALRLRPRRIADNRHGEVALAVCGVPRERVRRSELVVGLRYEGERLKPFLRVVAHDARLQRVRRARERHPGVGLVRKVVPLVPLVAAVRAELPQEVRVEEHRVVEPRGSRAGRVQIEREAHALRGVVVLAPAAPLLHLLRVVAERLARMVLRAFALRADLVEDGEHVSARRRARVGGRLERGCPRRLGAGEEAGGLVHRLALADAGLHRRVEHVVGVFAEPPLPVAHHAHEALGGLPVLEAVSYPHRRVHSVLHLPRAKT